MRARTLWLVLAVAVLAIACHVKGKRSEHELVGSHGEVLRAAFNRDIDKTRLLILVAPT